jgi:YidC/Oxa1 family membrane protein insertase
MWNTFIYEPIYNALIFIAQHISLQDVGLAVVILTIIIRLILSPLSRKSIAGQYKMRAIEPKLTEIKAKKLPKEEEMRQTMELYKQEKVNPYSGCLYILIQFPILIALNLVFVRGVYQPTHLYNTLSTQGLSNMFLGLVDITKPFFPFAILAGVVQALQAFLAPKPQTSGEEGGFQAQLTKSLSVQMKYVFPILIVIAASRFASAVSLYWAVANLFSVAQELYFRRTIKRKLAL